MLVELRVGEKTGRFHIEIVKSFKKKKKKSFFKSYIKLVKTPPTYRAAYTRKFFTTPKL